MLALVLFVGCWQSDWTNLSTDLQTSVKDSYISAVKSRHLPCKYSVSRESFRCITRPCCTTVDRDIPSPLVISENRLLTIGY
jgi:hypothetical protein